jgi:hypothetical protein
MRRPAIAALADAESDMNLALSMGWGQIKQGREAIAWVETDNSKGDGMMEDGTEYLRPMSVIMSTRLSMLSGGICVSGAKARNAT